MNRARYQRFEQRFYRGHTSTERAEEEDSEWTQRVCNPCGAIHLGRLDDPSPQCFTCTHQRNPYTGIRMSVEAEGEDSTNPQRVREGTSGFNLGLPGVTEPDGSYRPISNNEVATARKRVEYAKRNNLSVQEPSIKRAVGGK